MHAAASRSEVDAIMLNGNVRNYLTTMSTGGLRNFFKPIAAQRLHVNDPGRTDL